MPYVPPVPGHPPTGGTPRTAAPPEALLNSAPNTPKLEAIMKFWGHAYTFSHDPDDNPAEPYTAHRRDGKGVIRAATTAALLDAVKDDQAAAGIAP